MSLPESGLPPGGGQDASARDVATNLPMAALIG